MSIAAVVTDHLQLDFVGLAGFARGFHGGAEALPAFGRIVLLVCGDVQRLRGPLQSDDAVHLVGHGQFARLEVQ